MARRAKWQQTAERGGRWREADAAMALAAWRASGKTLSAFSEEQGLGKRLERWDRKLRRGDEAVEVQGPVALAPLIPVSVHGSSSSSVAVVVTGEEIRVEVADPSTAPARWVGELVQAMRGVQR